MVGAVRFAFEFSIWGGIYFQKLADRDTFVFCKLFNCLLGIDFTIADVTGVLAGLTAETVAKLGIDDALRVAIACDCVVWVRHV